MRQIAPGVFAYGNKGTPEDTLTVAEFLSRLTVDEEAAIERAAADISNGNPNARLAQAKHRVRLRRVLSMSRVNKTDPVVTEFLAAAQSDGLLTAERVTEILA